MKLDGRRESSNVEDRRGMSGGTKAGLGIGGIIVVALMAWISGGNPLEAVVQQVSENGGLGSLTGTNTEVSEGQREFTEEEQALAKFSTQILAGTEDVWLDADPGRYRGCVDGDFQAERCAVSEPHHGALYRWHADRLRTGLCRYGSLLLLWRPEAVYRPVVLHHDEKTARCRR